MNTLENHSRNVPDIYEHSHSKGNAQTILASTLSSHIEGALNKRFTVPFNCQSPRFQNRDSTQQSSTHFDTPGPGHYHLTHSLGNRLFKVGQTINPDVLVKGASRENNSFIPKQSE
eukprot:CAMPEP_0170555786 /NCGR_PEP_ID=MMETSP0211-20121228/13607_1 /TAXON_ID=311385 /ORGANISM="Pseudokeronopsis sp., Strain OXSARD2" /LENGTH=115 /DNA_ID=CAMNT_0010865775 /DNA_START=199 /DNA_END=546 /DNA_ORIENTATION=-